MGHLLLSYNQNAGCQNSKLISFLGIFDGIITIQNFFLAESFHSLDFSYRGVFEAYTI